MTDRKLYESLSKLGFPMFEPSEELDVNETLAEAIEAMTLAFGKVSCDTCKCF